MTGIEKQTANKYSDLRPDEKKKMMIIDELASHKISIDEKKDWIKTSFWVPEQTPGIERKLPPEPTLKLECPTTQHIIRLKKLVKLRINMSEDRQYNCYVCKKNLNFQKIGAIKGCGHTMCVVCTIYIYIYIIYVEMYN